MTDTTSTLFGTGEFFQRDNYAPVTNELTEFDLPVGAPSPPSSTGGTCATDPTRGRRPRTGSPATA